MIKNLLAFLISVLFIPLLLEGQEAGPDLGNKAYDLLNLPNLAGDNLSGQVVIAVIDDGFLLSHKATEGFYFLHDGEIPGNGEDDDGNGYIDDVSGWDAADSDQDVTPPEDIIEDYFHGTMVSSIIAKTVRTSLGPKASEHIKIMPIKALSDMAPNTSMEKGYMGMQYALDNNADIICLAWSGGAADEKYLDLFREASDRGILILGSAGNFNTGDLKPPATFSQVHCVAAIDSNFKKVPTSNYGLKVDISASGDRVMAAHPSDVHAYLSAGGTSSAVALITGCAALSKLKKPDARPHEIMAALKNTAIPVETFNAPYNGRLGAGRPDVSKALDYLMHESSRGDHFLSSRPEGDITISRKDNALEWEFQSSTATKKTHFILTSSRKSAGKGAVTFSDRRSVQYNSLIREMASEVEVNGNYAKMVFTGKPPRKPVTISYHSVPIDSITLYCDQMDLTGTEGEFSDGSGEEGYGHRISCKWTITVPEGKNIKLDFQYLDTESKVDYIYVFLGNETIQKNMMAKLSGHNRPPLLILGGNQILLWFVTDDKVNGDGWKATYKATDEIPGVFER